MMDGDEATPLETEPQLDFPVVGIGASAGGLEAVTAMVHQIEAAPGMAFVLVMHLDPDHESLMAELLSRKTHINVRQIQDFDTIEIDCLHIIPPGSSLRLEGDRFRLEPFSEPRGLRRPIDGFFASLASLQGEKSACVIVSGTGADGTAGLRVIKEFGGVAAVQTPSEARYDGMPVSAISTKLVDFTLPAEKIIARLQSYFRGLTGPRLSPHDQKTQNSFADIFSILSSGLGNDFSGYKKSTLLRRLNRRLQVLEYDDIDAYVARLREDPDEQFALAQDFLINVTSFFRDREYFEALRNQVLLPLVENAESSDEIRIWVPGCSSGQEAYTIAMLLDETCEELQRRPLIQIFATDLDEAMIRHARNAQYPVAMINELPKWYRERYTMGLDGKFEIISKIRTMVRFSIHNLLQDPPFSKIDLISCRNLIIYLGEELQNDLYPLLHFSLKPTGVLFLGTSENVKRKGELFSTLDQRARLFRRQHVARRGSLRLPLGRVSRELPHQNHPSKKMSQETDFPRHASLSSTNNAIYELYAPPFVRVTNDGRIIDSSGDLSLFIMARPNEERSLQSLARDGIRETVMPLVADAVARRARQALKDVEVMSPFGAVKVDVIAHPMADDTIALVFIQKERLQPIVDEFAVAPVSHDRRIADLQKELQATRLLLKGKVEENETANEELKSSNEEMMSMNEELQSANEELTTANEELKNKIDELTLANSDLDNFIHSADLAMVVLDRGLRIRNVTDAAQVILPIQQTDQGRAVTEFNIRLGTIDLPRELFRVMETQEVFAQATELDTTGMSYFVRISPYFFSDGSIEGVCLTVVDISQEARLRHELAVESERLKIAMRAGRMGLAELEVESGSVRVDEVLAQHLELDGPGTMTMDQMTANFVPGDIALLNQTLATAIEQNAEYELDFRVKTPRDDIRWVRTRGMPFVDIDGRKKLVGPTLDITDTNTIERREMLISEMSHRIKNLFAVISSLVSIVPKEADETKHMARELTQRISSLSNAYDLARRDHSLSNVDLGELFEAVIKPHATQQDLSISGDPVVVDGGSLNTLTLVIHELTTNASKYGALSVPDGALTVAWTNDGAGRVDVSWSETQSKPLETPEKEGFGSLLIRTGMQQLRGEFERRYTDTGVEVAFSIYLPD